MAAAVAVVEAVAINAELFADMKGYSGQQLYGFLESFQSGLGVSLESLEKPVFPFASRRRLKYRWLRITDEAPVFS
jgi:hypothetical protein